MNNKNKGVMLILISLLLLININNVNAFELTSEELSKEVCPSQTIIFTATVSGTGNFNVILEGSASSFATAVPQSVSLNNEAKTIFIYVTPSINVNPGKYNLNLIVGSGTNVKNINYEVNVINCFNIDVTGPTSKDVCACNDQVYEFTVTNNGIYQETYQVEVTGTASAWVSLDKDKITLNPAQSTKVIATLTAPCNTAGKNDFNIVVRSLTTNAVASFTSSSNVLSCFEFDARLSKDFINMCERTIETIPITITNLANEENEFSLRLTGPAWANLESNKLKLAANAKQDVNLILSPDYGIKGDFDINIKIDSSQGKIKKELAFKATIRTCHNVLLEILETQDKVCSNKAKTYQVNVKNLGEFEKEFKLESSEAWAKLSQNNVKLNPDEVRELSLEVNAFNVSAGMYKVNLKATALDTTKVSSEDSINLEIVSGKDCFKASLSAINTELNADTTATVPVTISNTGVEPATYLLGVSGNAASFIRLNPTSVILDPGKSEVVYLYIAPPFNTVPDTYKANIFTKLEETGILDSETIDIKVKSPGRIITPLEETFLDKFFANLRNLYENIRLSLVNITAPRVVEEVPEVEEEVEEDVEVEEVEELPLIELVNKTIISGDVKFNFKGEHVIKIREISSKDVTLEISSNPTFVILDLNETEQVDLNNDNRADISLTLKSIKDGVPEIEVSKIERELPTLISGLSFVKLKENIVKYRAWIIGIIVLILILILLFATNIFKKANKLVKKEAGKEGIKIGKYVLLIIVLALLIWLFRKYSGYWGNVISFITTYRTFIILGIIILIILILIINYWKQIVDFFEEDVEEEANMKKRKRK